MEEPARYREAVSRDRLTTANEWSESVWLRRWCPIFLLGVGAQVCVAFADDAGPPAPAKTVDPAVCADPAAADCTALIDSDKTELRSKIAALLLRAKALTQSNQATRALSDYDKALSLDPTMTDVLNTRGELRRALGDRPRALADFTAVLKIRPDHAQARENRKSLSLEIERIGAEMAVGKKRDAAPLK